MLRQKNEAGAVVGRLLARRRKAAANGLHRKQLPCARMISGKPAIVWISSLRNQVQRDSLSPGNESGTPLALPA